MSTVEQVPVTNVFSAEARRRPYALFATMRETSVLHLAPTGNHLVLAHADCAAVLADPAWGRGYSQGLNTLRPGVDPADLPGSFLLMDPPEHTRMRGLVSHAFTPRRIAEQREAVTTTVGDLLDAAVADGEVDLVRSFARPVALTTICRMLGVPVADLAHFSVWMEGLVRAFDPEPLLSPADIRARDEALAALGEYFAAAIVRRRDDPRDDLVSHLARASDGDDRLTSKEVTDVCVGLLIAGQETTQDVISSAVLGLHPRPDQAALLREQPELVRPAVDEFVRLEPPVPFPHRTALVDSEVAGVPMPRGSGVHLLLGAANRDPEVYADPDRLDVTRFAGPNPPPRHLAFSHGAHFCMGAALARLEVEIALTAVLQRCPDLEVLDDDPPLRPTFSMRGLAELPVRL